MCRIVKRIKDWCANKTSNEAFLNGCAQVGIVVREFHRDKEGKLFTFTSIKDRDKLINELKALTGVGNVFFLPTKNTIGILKDDDCQWKDVNGEVLSVLLKNLPDE